MLLPLATASFLLLLSPTVTVIAIIAIVAAIASVPVRYCLGQTSDTIVFHLKRFDFDYTLLQVTHLDFID